MEFILSVDHGGLFNMENSNIFKKGIGIYHLPTLMLAIGYPVYWRELYFLNSGTGVTSSLAAILFGLAALTIYLGSRQSGFSLNYSLSHEKTPVGKMLILIVAGLAFGLLAVAFYASLYPPHLMQEYDVLNYHYTIPRQHLLLRSFATIPWSSADLFPLPIQFALAPFWFVTELPNKVPQFLFLVGLLAVAANLVRKFTVQPISILFIIAAILGSHNVGIQMGTGMLDLVICYLFLAALDSFLEGEIWLAAIEFTFFFWSKSFIPVQMILIMMAMTVLAMVLKKLRFKSVKWDIGSYVQGQWAARTKKFIYYFVLLSLFIGGPFAAKSLYQAGTPLFPLGVGRAMVNPNIDQDSVGWDSLLRSTKDHLGARDAYGYGRSFENFVKHFWLIAVPDKGVNNKFDYPVGLVYLLFIVPFLWEFTASLRKKEFSVTPWFIVIYWLSWWFGSQQTRFLYIPLILMFIVIINMQKYSSKILLAMLALAMGLNFLSVTRAHQKDFGFKREEVLRVEDRQVFIMSQKYLQQGRHDVVPTENHEMAFAQFPVIVAPERLPYVLAINPSIIASQKGAK